MSKKEKRKVLLLLAAMLAIIVVFGIVMTLLEKHMPEAAVTDAGFLAEDVLVQQEEAKGSVLLGGKHYDYTHEYETYLFIGTDDTGTSENENYQGSMSDFLLLVVLDQTADTYSFLPINRDTMTDITLLQKDGTGKASAELQICTAHWYGGSEEQSCENTVEAVSHLLGNIPINGYYCLSMNAIPELNHAIGGVEVTLLEDFTKVDKQMTKGRSMTLTDSQAYHYIHDRYGIGDEENISRMRRQQQYIQAMFKKARRQLKENKTFLYTLYQEMEENAITNIKGKKVSRLAKEMPQAEEKGFYELEGRFELGQALGDGINHVEFYVDKNSLIQVMTELYGLKKRNGD